MLEDVEVYAYCVFPRPLPPDRVKAVNLASNVADIASKPLAGGWRACRHFIGGRAKIPVRYGGGGKCGLQQTSPPLPSSFHFTRTPEASVVQLWAPHAAETGPRPEPPGLAREVAAAGLFGALHGNWQGWLRGDL